MDAGKYSLAHLLLEITAENVHPETDVGPSVVAAWSSNGGAYIRAPS
jgi:hypothetical protein